MNADPPAQQPDAAPVVVKFYRPGRWSDAAIVEEHHDENGIAWPAALAALAVPV